MTPPSLAEIYEQHYGEENETLTSASETLSDSELRAFIFQSFSPFLQESDDTLNAIAGILLYHIGSHLDTVIRCRVEGEHLILEGSFNNTSKVISLNIPQYLRDGENPIFEEISYDEAAARYQEAISSFQLSVTELEILSNAINSALERNDDEAWEVIDENDIITEGPFTGKTLVEAVLIYRRSILESSVRLRNLGPINPEEQPDLMQARERLYDANEEYLLLILGIGENREELTHVIPKTQSECLQLIQGVISRRNPQEILEWMRDVHTQIDANNWQDGTVEQNYRYFSDTLNVLALEKIRTDIFENDESDNYRNPQLLLDFAVLVSGRPAWNRESGLLTYDWGRNASPVDSRLWSPEIANQALIYAMDVETEHDSGESQSMISEMMEYLELTEPLLGERTPQDCATTAFEMIRDSVHNGEGTLSQLHENQFRTFLESLGYLEIYNKTQNENLADSYSELSLKDMIAISGLVRISEGIEDVTSQEAYDWFTLMLDEPYELQPGEEIVEEREVWTFTGIKYHYKIRRNYVSFDSFSEIVQSAGQNAVQHVGDELDRNFDDGFWEQFAELNVPFANMFLYETEEERAAQFGISPDSLEYQIFTLYNDINGNGNAEEVSDNTRVVLRTAGYMLAMVAGSMILGGGIGLAINAARAAQGLAAISVATQGAIMGASGSAVGYGLDTLTGDALGFYTPQEAAIGLATDFALGAGTGALSGPLAQALPNVPNPIVFATDLTALGLGPEMYRLHLMQQTWHGSDIFIQGENPHPFLGEIEDGERVILSHDLYGEELQEYLSHSSEAPSRSNYRFFLREFHGFGFETDDIPIEFDRRFLQAYIAWRIFNPGNYLNVWQTEPEFTEAMENREGGFEDMKTRIFQATESWIERQEERIVDVL